MSEDALADALAEETPAVAGAPPEEGASLGGYNPSDGDPPLEEQDSKPTPTPEEIEAKVGEDDGETFPENPDQAPAGPDPEEEEHERTAEEQTIVEESEAGGGAAEEPPAPPAPEPPAEPKPKPKAKKKSKARVYLVFEETGREKKNYSKVPECLYTGAEQIKLKEANSGNADYEPPTGELVSRNGDNALRAAYRRLAAAREDEDLRTVLVIVAENSWRPRNVKPRQRNLPPALEIT